MPVGVTTFISAGLAAGRKFSIGGSLNAKAGLAIGRETDMLVRDVVRKGRQLNKGARHARAAEFFRVMATHHIKVVEVQRRAVDHALDIRTEVDAIGTDREKRRVAIELKTSQHTRAAFSAAYYTRCRNKAELSNGLPNCLYWRHQLQVAFGVLATDCTRGVVAVMCSDGGLLFELSPTALSRALFAGAATLTNKAYAPVCPYPHGADDELTAALRKRRKCEVVGHEPTLLRGPFGDAVLLIVHKGPSYAATRAAKGHRELARSLAATRKVACVIGWVDKGHWRFETVARRPKL